VRLKKRLVPPTPAVRRVRRPVSSQRETCLAAGTPAIAAYINRPEAERLQATSKRANRFQRPLLVADPPWQAPKILHATCGRRASSRKFAPLFVTHFGRHWITVWPHVKSSTMGRPHGDRRIDRVRQFAFDKPTLRQRVSPASQIGSPLKRRWSRKPLGRSLEQHAVNPRNFFMPAKLLD